mmetsp:Transcript_120531/g.257369  ORF Transcript_120531/g.257369 Transcript_120531/m.257369 type:complete len:251 (+) Transcript_120531:3149-3901(+)
MWMNCWYSSTSRGTSATLSPSIPESSSKPFVCTSSVSCNGSASPSPALARNSAGSGASSPAILSMSTRSMSKRSKSFRACICSNDSGKLVSTKPLLGRCNGSDKSITGAPSSSSLMCSSSAGSLPSALAASSSAFAASKSAFCFLMMSMFLSMPKAQAMRRTAVAMFKAWPANNACFSAFKSRGQPSPATTAASSGAASAFSAGASPSSSSAAGASSKAGRCMASWIKVTTLTTSKSYVSLRRPASSCTR